MRYCLPLLVLVACADPGAPQVQQLRPTVEIIGGSGQTDTVAKELPLAVVAKVSDSMGRALSGVPLNWFRVVGSDSIFAGVGASNDTGVALIRWTLHPKAGPQQMVAWVLDGNGNRSEVAAAIATATPDRADTIVLGQPSATLALGEKFPLSFAIDRLADRFGNSVPNVDGLTYEAGSWHRSRDTIWSDVERRDTVWMVSGPRSVPFPVSAWYNILAHQWDVTFTCYGSVASDSARYAVTTDTVYRVNGSQGWMEGSGTVRHFLRAGGELVEPLGLRIGWTQSPDSLSYRTWPNSYGETFQQGVGVVTATSPRSYVGGNLCATGWTSAGPATVTGR